MPRFSTIGALLALVLATCTVASAATAASGSVGDYRIHEGDVLHVAVVGENDLSGDVRVVDDGSISLPLVGVVRVGGLTTVGASDAISSKLQRYVKTPSVSVAVQKLGQITVVVSGAVEIPGTYTLPATAHVSDALAAAGGISKKLFGTYPDGWLEPQGGTSRKIATNALVRGGDQRADLALADGDAVFIPAPASISVSVLGAVDTPGVVQVYAGQRLSAAIAAAGSSDDAHADLSHIIVTRTESDGKTASHQIDLYRAIDGSGTGGHVDLRYDPVLRQDDVVYVPMTRRTRGVLTNTLFLITQLAGY